MAKEPNQTKVLRVLRNAGASLDIKGIGKRTKKGVRSGGLNENQIRHALRDLNNRGLLKKEKEKRNNASKNNPPFQRTKYTYNRKKRDKIERVLNAHE